MPVRGTLSTNKAKRLINYKSKWPLKIGYKEYIKWYIDFTKKINKEKVVISGLGSIGAQHLSFIEKNKNLQLISVYDTDKNKYKNIKNKETLKSKTFSQLLNNKVNYAIIASPDEDHCSQIIRCLKKR